MVNSEKILLNIIDTIIMIASLFISALLLDKTILLNNDSHIVLPILSLLCTQLILFNFFLYHKMTRYAGLIYFIKLSLIIWIANIVFIALNHLFFEKNVMSLLILNSILSSHLIMYARIVVKYYLSFKKRLFNPKKTLIYGAGEIGLSIVKVLKKNELNYKISGFLDDDIRKHKRSIEGISVLGNIDSLELIHGRKNINELIIAFNNPSREFLSKIFKKCRNLKIKCRVIPGITSFLNQLPQPRDIEISDFISRPERSLNKNEIQSFLNDKKILITGGAGSIGSEILFQILKYNPKQLLIMDHSELGIYSMQEKLSSHPLKEKCLFSLTDIKLTEITKNEILNFKPEITFHAAAYKHVPILENQIKQALENNVVGLKNVLDACEACKTSKFIFISTDKAVNPTNIMGCTKRIGELIIESFQGDMECVAVRFGNVLASSGSVIPKFVKQIKAGGPVTVTHPEMTRYFMLIPEAVELVLQASVIGIDGDVMVLDMGDPIKINDLAENLIYSMGLIPKEDIEIIYTGLREGEKMHEELFYNDADRIRNYKDIYLAKDILAGKETKASVEELINALTKETSNQKLISMIKKLVPEYKQQI